MQRMTCTDKETKRQRDRRNIERYMNSQIQLRDGNKQTQTKMAIQKKRQINKQTEGEKKKTETETEKPEREKKLTDRFNLETQTD